MTSERPGTIGKRCGDVNRKPRETAAASALDDRAAHDRIAAMRMLSYPLAALLLATALSSALAADSPAKLYSDRHGFTLRVPANATIETDPQENDQLDVVPTAAVVVKLDPAVFKDTNLSEASISVGVGNDPSIVAGCSAGKAAQGEKAAGTATLGGIKFTRFTFEDEGAGNRYASTIYRATSGGNCYELVEFLHYAAMENFSPGAIKQFDRAKIEAELRAITRSFAITGRAL